MNLSLILADSGLYGSTLFGNATSFTFFVGCMAMMAASVFFFCEMGNVDKKWRTSLLVSGLITFIAFVHYYYMRDYYLWTGTADGAAAIAAGNADKSPVDFRYVDWTLTVPLMCVEFYLITKKAGATMGLLWKLIFASVVMLVTGYLGEVAAVSEANASPAAMWGLASGLAYFYIVYLVFSGEVKQLADKAGGAVAEANKWLGRFVLVGWAIYPIGYMIGTAGWYGGVGDIFGYEASMDVVYNIGDAINKIGFGLVIYTLAVKDSNS